MPPKLRGKWALGITPRNFTWVIKDCLAICERPGGYGDNHRRVRRQEEIIWLRENHSFLPLCSPPFFPPFFVVALDSLCHLV